MWDSFPSHTSPEHYFQFLRHYFLSHSLCPNPRVREKAEPSEDLRGSPALVSLCLTSPCDPFSIHTLQRDELMFSFCTQRREEQSGTSDQIQRGGPLWCSSGPLYLYLLNRESTIGFSFFCLKQKINQEARGLQQKGAPGCSRKGATRAALASVCVWCWTSRQPRVKRTTNRTPLTGFYGSRSKTATLSTGNMMILCTFCFRFFFFFLYHHCVTCPPSPPLVSPTSPVHFKVYCPVFSIGDDG